MRTLLIAMVLGAAPAAAQPGKDAPVHDTAVYVWVPGVDVTELTVTGAGGVQTMVIHDALSQLDAATLQCYRQAQAQHPKLAGTLALRFRLDAKGAASSVTVTGVPGVNGCLSDAIKAVTFAGPAKGPIELREKISLRLVTSIARGGILGSATLSQGAAFASLTGSGDVSSGFDDANVLGGLVGDQAGNADLRGGLRATAAASVISSGQITAQGDLDKAIIRRYIHRNLQKLQYCYEKQLLSTPGLAGTVTAKFTIGVTGKVTSSTASGMSSTGVSSCIADVIGDIEFPKPKGGEVVVSYPFTFRPSADDKK